MIAKWSRKVWQKRMHGANCEWQSARAQLATQLWRVAGVLLRAASEEQIRSAD